MDNIIIKGPFGELHLSRYDDVLSYPNSHQIHYLSIPSNIVIEEIIALPPNLQIFNCCNNKLKKLPYLPSTIRHIFVKTNKIEEFPIITHCHELEELNLNDNYICEIDTVFPSSLKTLDLSFNKLRKINYMKVNPEIVSIVCSYCFLSELPPSNMLSRMTLDHNDIPSVYFAQATIQIIINNLPNGRRHGVENERYIPPRETNRIGGGQIYENSQNVHASSVQNSVNKSLDYILNYNPNRVQSGDIVDNIRNAMKKKKKWYHYIIPSSLYDMSYLDTWCKDTTIHSIHGITYKQLLERVWWIIQDHQSKEAMIEVLREELEASKYVCFTGRFSRTLNALSGFVEEVQIGISKQEQMQNQIAMAIKKARSRHPKDNEAYVILAKEEVSSILAEFAVPLLEKEAWLDAIE